MQWLVLAALEEAVFLRIRFLGDLRQHVAETIAWLLVSALFYLVSSASIIRRWLPPPPMRLVVGAALLFRLTLWPLAPAISDDVFRYRWEGKLQAAGGNPYHVRPNDAAWAGLKDTTFDRIPGRDFKAVYGPLLELMERLTYWAAKAEPDPFRQAYWFKLPAALFELGAMAALAALLDGRGVRDRLLIYAWSPLVVFEFWSSGHNDAIAVALLAGALAAQAYGRRTPAFALLTLAGAAKLWPFLLAPLFLGRDPRRWLPVLIAVPILTALIWPYWTPEWRNVQENARFLSGFVGGWRNNDSLFGGLLALAGGQIYAAKKLAVGISLAAVAVVFFIRLPLEGASLWVLATLLLVSANCHPWYLTWLVPLLAVEWSWGVILWACLAPLGHAPVIEWAAGGEWNGSTAVRWWIYVPVFAAFAWEAIRFLRSRVGPSTWPVGGNAANGQGSSVL